MNTEDVKKILANPFYCLSTVDPVFCVDHEPLVSEEQFIACGVQAIKEIGAEQYLKTLLENLKGNWPVPEIEDSPNE